MTVADKSVGCEPIEGAVRALLAIEESAASNQKLREKLLSLELKLSSNQLHLAVLGQMKRGKSSFINALLGAQVLPTGVLPVTAVIAEIRHGQHPEATILYTTGLRESVELSALADYMTEDGNPGNRKQVASVEISYPSSFLESGIVLIDTPGIGSTHAHNTRTTEQYLEQVDAGIVVLSVDPPITAAEANFIRQIKEDVPKLFFVLNKTDAASPEEMPRISGFLEDELGRLQVEAPEIFSLSARSALQWKQHRFAPSDMSGIDACERRLRRFFAEEKREVLVRSVALDVLQIARSLKFAVAIGVRALTMTAEELRHKRVTLSRLLDQTEMELGELRMLLRQHSGELVARIERDLAAYVEDSVPAARQHLQAFQEKHPRETGQALGTVLEDFLMREVEAIFRKWRALEDERVQAELNAISSRLVAKANGSLERLQQAAGSLFETPVESVRAVCPLRVESHLYYKVERVFYSLDSFLLALPRFLLRPLVLRKMNRDLWQLLDRNAGRIRYDYLERLQSSLAQFEKELVFAVAMVTDSLKTALDKPQRDSERDMSVVDVLDSVMRDCARLLS